MNLALNDYSLRQFQLLDELGILDHHLERAALSERVTLSEDADKRAVADLTSQAKSLEGDRAKLIRARRDQLQAEISAEQSFKRALSSSRRELVTLLQMATASSDPELLLSLNNEQLLDFILKGGMGSAVDEYIESQGKIRSAVEKAFQVIAPEFSFDAIPQLEMIETQAVTQVFEDVILPDTQSAIRSALTSLALEVPPEIIMSELEERLRRSEGRQLTEVKTSISQYGRSITAAAAAAADLDHYLYTGPLDGVTRGFCKALVDKVVTSEQMRKLNNGQGLNVMTSCGGYNCRHTWSPVSEGFIESAKLDLATAADITRANARGRR
jgi:hypothetical protein